jgi:hypothetical protein
VSTFFGSIPAAVILLRRLPVVGAPLSPKPVSISTRLRPVLTITTLNWLMVWSVGRNARNATPANLAVNKTLPDIQKALGDD